MIIELNGDKDVKNSSVSWIPSSDNSTYCGMSIALNKKTTTKKNTVISYYPWKERSLTG